jgi:hypothetical protein
LQCDTKGVIHSVVIGATSTGNARPTPAVRMWTNVHLISRLYHMAQLWLGGDRTHERRVCKMITKTNGLSHWLKWVIVVMLSVVLCLLAFPRVTSGGPQRDPTLCLRVYTHKPKGPCIQLGREGDYKNIWINTFWSWNRVLNDWGEFSAVVGEQQALAFLVSYTSISTDSLLGTSHRHENRPSLTLVVIELLGFVALFSRIGSLISNRLSNLQPTPSYSWKCKECGAPNTRYDRVKCSSCGAPKPVEE